MKNLTLAQFIAKYGIGKELTDFQKDIIKRITSDDRRKIIIMPQAAGKRRTYDMLRSIEQHGIKIIEDEHATDTL